MMLTFKKKILIKDCKIKKIMNIQKSDNPKKIVLL